MGVPKFFRWLSERYPCLCEELKEYQIPEFDNLYLDMNGIIHVCSHPNDFDPHFRISEEKIFTDIFHYIEVLFRLIRPKKLFFMAVDGVAPRAKMNQQRGRRFSSAKEAETLEKKALEKGECLPKEKRFDSNCITPGTQFMAKLQEQLKYFVAHKMSTDKLWQKPTIILSGHSVPGEGEHKIMDYIRYLRAKPDWDPRTRHCLYGLDADLIILGLCTHEPNFSLLREEVKFVKQNKRAATPETTNYVLLHLSLLRGYLDLEFQSLKKGLPFPYDIEKVIDDWVLLGFLVGNDFIPHLPHLHIHCNALTILYDTYRAVLPKLDGYINENGVLNLPRFERFLTELSQFDAETFSETYADMKYFESKTGRKLFPELQVEDNGRKVKMCEDALQALIKSSELEMFDFGEDDSDLDEALESKGLETFHNDEEQDKLFNKEFVQHKRDYYLNKMEFPSVSKDVIRKEAEVYVTALQWILYYYYRGCPSWSWYYPHHYTPYVTDLKGFSNYKIEFNLGKPFLPFQQLLAVLPSASKEFLPECYQSLMVSCDSPIIDYYPKDFKFDLNGKRQEWEAVVLIPFIGEKRLLEAMDPFTNQLTDDEIFRNSHGPMQIYKYSSQSLGKYQSPQYFPTVSSNHAKYVEKYPNEVGVSTDVMVFGRHPALFQLGTGYLPGFPLLSALDITGNLEKRSVKVFEHPSRSENMIIRVVARPELKDPLKEIAERFLMEDYIYVSYPHFTPAKPSMLVSEDSTAILDNGDGSKPTVRIQRNSSSAQSVWKNKLNMLLDHHLSRFGIDLAGCKVVVFARPLEGTAVSFVNTNLQKKMIWSQDVVGYPLDTCMLDINGFRGESSTVIESTTMADVYPPGTIAFMIGPMDYGYQLQVEEVVLQEAKLLVNLTQTTEPDLTPVREAINSSVVQYYHGYQCAERLGISSHLFSRITSGIIVQSPHTDSDKTNIGLSLKFSRSNQQMIGYTKKEGNQWLYSDRCIEMVNQYMEKFPDLFDYLSANLSDDIFFKDRMFPNDKSAERLVEIKTWLKTLEKGETRSVESELLEPALVKVLEDTLTSYTQEDFCLKTLRLRPACLYLPRPDLMITSPDPEAEHHILDRIVFVRESHSIPVGAKGVIIGIEKKLSKALVCEDTGWTEAATLYDVVFDQEVIGGQALYGTTKKLVYRLNKQVFINISYGQRKFGDDVTSPPLSAPVRASRRSSNRDNFNANKYEKAANAMMPSFNQPRNSNWRQPANRNNTPNTTPNYVNGQASPTKTSGSVKDFFNAYKNNTANSNTNEMGRSVHNPPSSRPVPPQNQPDASVNPLTDMWNLLKNLQVNNVESVEQETPKADVIIGSSVIRSQTFTRTGQQQDSVNQVQSQSFMKPPSSQHPEGVKRHLDNNNQQPSTMISGNTGPPPNRAFSLPSHQIPPTQNQKPAIPGLLPHPSRITNNHQFVEQTEALKKILCLDGNSNLENNVESGRRGGDQPRNADQRPSTVDGAFSQVKSCGHLPSCMAYFNNLCSLYNVEKPFLSRDGYKAACKFSDGFKLVGPAMQSPEQAREALACLAIDYVSSHYRPPSEANQLPANWRQGQKSGVGSCFPPPPPTQLLKAGMEDSRNSVATGLPPYTDGTPAQRLSFVPPQVSRPRSGVSGRVIPNPLLISPLLDLDVLPPVQFPHQVRDQRPDPSSPHHRSPKAHGFIQNNSQQTARGHSEKRKRPKMRIAANFQNPLNPVKK